MAGNPKFQSSLGTVFERRYKDGSNIDKISFARVTKVNYRYNTVDIQSVRGDFATNTSGRLSAQLPIQFGGTTKEGKVFGQVNPIEVGTYVLVGFVEGKKTSPVVLSVYGGEDESQNLSRTPFEEADPSDEELKQLTQQQFTVYPSLTYDNIDGEGNRTVTFTGKSFVTTEAGADTRVGGLTDELSGTEYEELETSYYYSGELIEPKEGRAPVILFKHQGERAPERDGSVGEGTHNYMWFLDSDGTYRTSLMQEDEDWRAFFEMTPDGKIQMVRQNDSKKLNATTDRYSVGVEEAGIRLRVGNRYALITPYGTFGNLGWGTGGSSGADGSDGADGSHGAGGNVGEIGGIPQHIYDEIEKTLDEANRRIIAMDTYFERTDAFISMGANMLEQVEGGMDILEANFTIMADEIRQSVSELNLRELISVELDAFMDTAWKLNKEAEEQLRIIRKFVEDGKLTPEEKEIMGTGYQNIKLEYPAYFEQAVKNDRDTTKYEWSYKTLVELMDPILSNPETISEVDPIAVIEAYENYYDFRQDIVVGILNDMQKEISRIARETSKAASDAAGAITDSGTALSEAESALNGLKNIVDTNMITPKEKRSLSREIELINTEYEGHLERAKEYGVPTARFEDAYGDLGRFIESSRIFEDLFETSEVDGQRLFDVVERYYQERIRILNEIAKANRDQLRGLQANFEHHQTAIIETSKEIKLMADSVYATEGSIRVAQARLSIMSGRIQSTVSDTTFRREVNEYRNTLNATGRNLFVMTTALEGRVLDPDTGEVKVSGRGATSKPIRISSGVQYSGSVYENTGTNLMVIAYYDRGMEFISGAAQSISGGSSYDFIETSAPPKAMYARMSIDNKEIANVQFERGTSSKYYMYANEDLINNLSNATEERLKKEIAWKDKETRMIEGSNGATSLLHEVGELLGVEVIKKEAALSLIDEINLLEEESGVILSEAKGLEIITINIELAMGTLKSVKAQYLEPIIEGNKDDLSSAERMQISNRFEDYLKLRGGYYERVNDMFKISYEAAVEILDEVLVGSLEAERIAREAAQAAEEAAQDVSVLEEQLAEGIELRKRHKESVENISENGVLTPVDKENLITLKSEIDDEISWLIAQGNSIGLSTKDVMDAFVELDSYMYEITKPEKMMEPTEINSQTLNVNFERYHEYKIVFIENLHKEAKERLARKEEGAKLTREETLRRDREYQKIKNIIEDSELAVERIEKKIREIENTHAYSIELLSTNGFTFNDRIVSTTLRATVRQGVEDITEDLPNRNFEWYKTKASGEEDLQWNRAHKGVGNEVSISHEDVTGSATFTVEVYVDEEEEE